MFVIELKVFGVCGALMFKVISHLRIFLRFNGLEQKIAPKSKKKTQTSNEAVSGKSRLKRYSN